MSMTDGVARRGLGRGLSALLRDDDGDDDSPEGAQVRKNALIVPLERLRPGPFQPRRDFDAETMQELTQSVRRHGVLQPVLVRIVADGPEEFYEILAGERRWRAACQANITTIPIVVRHDVDDAMALELALVENIHRTDLAPMEEAEGYQRLISEFGHTQENLAAMLDKNRSHIANMLRMLSLPDAVQEMIREGKLSFGHAKVLTGAMNSERLAREIFAQSMTVREAEQLMRGQPEKALDIRKMVEGIRSGEFLPPEVAKKPTRARARRAGAPRRQDGVEDLYCKSLEERVGATLGLKVEIKMTHKTQDRGHLTVHFHTLDQLDSVIGRLNASDRGYV